MVALTHWVCFLFFLRELPTFFNNNNKFTLNAVPTGDMLLLLLLLFKKVGSARLRESGIHPISPKTPAPKYQPIDRKKRKGKKVEDYSRDSVAAQAVR